MQRREFIKGAVAANLMLAVQFISPNAAAKIDREVFSSKTADEAMKGILGDIKAEESDKIMIKAPELAENGANVPIEVKTDIEGAERIVLVVLENPTPLAGEFIFGEGVTPNIKTRCRIGKPSDVVVMVAAGDKIYTNKAFVKVTKGGC